MKKPRDTRRPVEYWNESLASTEKHFHSNDNFVRYKQRLKEGEVVTDAMQSLELYTEAYVEDITYTYCRGDDLSDIKEKYIDIGIDRFVLTAGEYEKHRKEIEEQGYSPYWNYNFFYPHDVHSSYCMVSWFLCFGADPKKIGEIAPYLVKAGHDRLVDTILQRFQPDREISTEDACGRTFKLLQSVMDVDEKKAIKNLEKYLANWGKLMGTLKGLRSIGLLGTEGAKSNESLIANLDTIKNISYVGFWAWEVAMVVRFFEIDDSSFCDHEFYPKDLAHFKPG